jgi:hypothetical protein
VSNLKIQSEEIRNIIENKKEKLSLNFLEEDHIYFMKDLNGEIRNDFPSVSKVIKKFYKEFDSEGISYNMANGNLKKQQKILNEWKQAADYSTNIGSRTHFYLEKKSIEIFDLNKDVRKPDFECDLEQIIKSDAMIKAGTKFLELMKERGATLVDTELILGDPELGYVGTPDKIWLIENKEKNDVGIVITDYKTNKPKSFTESSYTDRMYPPFEKYPNNALGHYYIQLPLYGKLLLKMLKDTKYEKIKIYGCILAHLRDDSQFEEFRVPKDILDKILEINIKNYL